MELLLDKLGKTKSNAGLSRGDAENGVTAVANVKVRENGSLLVAGDDVTSSTDGQSVRDPETALLTVPLWDTRTASRFATARIDRLASRPRSRRRRSRLVVASRQSSSIVFNKPAMIRANRLTTND